eukprot:scaffold343550_cov48-Attheya_sp.AAC.2
MHFQSLTGAAIYAIGLPRALNPNPQCMGCFQHHNHAGDVQFCICIQPRHQCMGCIQCHKHQTMFYNAAAFNQDRSAWDVSSVTNMLQMFSNGALAFNQDLSAWDVSSVTTMYMMFFYASAFNQDLSAWDVSSIKSMNRMFRGASVFNQNLCSWASKSPQLLSIGGMFQSSSCNNSSAPVLNSGTPVDPHDGPFCFTC